MITFHLDALGSVPPDHCAGPVLPLTHFWKRHIPRGSFASLCVNSISHEGDRLSSALLCRAAWQKCTDVSKLLTASTIQAAMMEAVSTYETSAKFYQITWRNNPENKYLHTRSRENLNFQFQSFVSCMECHGFKSRPMLSFLTVFLSLAIETT
jgi:hypothetical protein